MCIIELDHYPLENQRTENCWKNEPNFPKSEEKGPLSVLNNFLENDSVDEPKKMPPSKKV